MNFFLAHNLIKIFMRQGNRLLFCKPLALCLSHVQMKMQKFIGKFRVKSFGYASSKSFTPRTISSLVALKLARKRNISAMSLYTIALLFGLASSASSIGIKEFILNLSFEKS